MRQAVRTVHDRALAAPLDERSLQLRRELVAILTASRRGHLGASASLIEIIRVLYDDVLQFDPANPTSQDRDRFILSKGHGCLAQYLLLADKGFFPKADLTSFCADCGMLGGHPCATKIPGVEVSTGALGHGLPVGIGMALALKATDNPAKVFVVMGDGECNEGSVWEAAMSASKHSLSNLIAMVDYNKYQSYGETSEIQDLEPFSDKWESFGFAVREVNGHDVNGLREVLLAAPFEEGKPSAIICHTVKGKGFPFAENNLNWHHKSNLSDEQISEMLTPLERGSGEG